MSSLPPHSDGAAFWLYQLFSEHVRAENGIVWRDTRWVAREIGRKRLIDEARLRGYHVLEFGDQTGIIFHRGPIRLIS
jgi:hypothetical protein